MNNEKRKQIPIVIYYLLMMVITGCSDGLRGVFLPLFEESFTLTKTASSMIIMCSYVGNLLFLLIGGYFLDRISKKKFLCIISIIWMCSLLTYVLTFNYYVLLIAMIFSLGASTMISTSLNVLIPILFVSPAFFINVSNFTGGAGIFAAQNIGGKFSDYASAWHIINLILLILGIVALFLLLRIHIPKQDTTPKEPILQTYKKILCKKTTLFLILVCGFYYVAEHGLQCWMVSYGSQYLGYTRSTASLYLSLFFGGITIGRLIFSPIVQKIGASKSIFAFEITAVVLYSLGIYLGKSGMALLILSGLAYSILWPTIVLWIGSFFKSTENGQALGIITGIATLFDIAFNCFFGTIIDNLGFAISMRLLPFALVACFICFILAEKQRKAISKEN